MFRNNFKTTLIYVQSHGNHGRLIFIYGCKIQEQISIYQDPPYLRANTKPYTYY